MKDIATNILVYLTLSVGIIRQQAGARTRNRRHYLAAERHYSAVLVLKPHNTYAKRARGLLRWRELNDPEGAIEDFLDLRQSDPNYHDGLFYEGMARVELGQYAEAASLFRQFIEVAPKSKWAHSATLQLQSLNAILGDIPKQLPPSAHDSQD
ncbi:MAG: hypothetical protein CUN55_03925 [Phototrophicales bacterium]|nr:MAG: hypothetical protein CUN55_03925 [Phototrophicales bacterium]